MKKTFLLIVCLLLMTACGNKTAQETTQPSAEREAGTAGKTQAPKEDAAGGQTTPDAKPQEQNANAGQATQNADPPEQNADAGQTTPGAAAARLLYMGQSSFRIVTGEGKVIYVDPYAGDGYDLPADLILVTHGHYDHNAVEKIENRNDDCRIITWKEALQDGIHQTFDPGYVTVEAVEAGYNAYHDVRECVGYVLTLSDGVSLYFTGDTSTTRQMPLLAAKQIDYAFYCCDGVYNMDAEEAAACARMVGAKHNIPCHVIAQDGTYFDRERAEQFPAENLLVVDEGEEIELSP